MRPARALNPCPDPHPSALPSLCLLLFLPQVEREVVEEAARWIRKWVPLSLRAKFAAFRSPKWAKDPGPMRVIILDNRTNEQVCIYL